MGKRCLNTLCGLSNGHISPLRLMLLRVPLRTVTVGRWRSPPKIAQDAPRQLTGMQQCFIHRFKEPSTERFPSRRFCIAMGRATQHYYSHK